LDGIYYEPNSNYYWDSVTGVYYHFDKASQRYTQYNIPSGIDKKENSVNKGNAIEMESGVKILSSGENPIDIAKNTESPMTLDMQNQVFSSSMQLSITDKSSILLNSAISQKPQENLSIAQSATTIGSVSGNISDLSSVPSTSSSSMNSMLNSNGAVMFSLKPTKKLKKDTNPATSGSSIFQKKISKEIEKWSQKSKELSQAIESFQKSSQVDSKSQPQAKHPSSSSLEPLKNPQVTSSQEPVSLRGIFSEKSIASNSDSLNNNMNESSNPPIVSVTSTGSVTEKPPTSALLSAYICTLCKRQFNSKETLIKHENLSELHKKNLAQKQQQQEEKERGQSNLS